MVISSISPNGDVKIVFSEKLMAMNEFPGLNLTIINLLKLKIFNITYECNVLANDQNKN